MVRSFDPFRDVDRLVDQMFTTVGSRAALGMPMDLYRSGDHYVLHCELTGIDPGSLDISVEGSQLTITAQRSLRTDEGVEWLVRERPTGRFARRLILPEDVDSKDIAATYEDGVLTVTMPVAAAAKPRKIAISGAGHQVLEGKTAESKAINESNTS